MKAPPLFARRSAAMKRSAIRELLRLTARPDMISFAGGLPAPEIFPMEAIQEASATILRRQGTSVMQYGETEGVGSSGLGGAIAHNLRTRAPAGERANHQRRQQALDLIGRVLVDDGDTVRVENPTYLAALSAWRPCGARFEAIPDEASDRDGAALQRLLESPVKLVYVVPNFEHPPATPFPIIVWMFSSIHATKTPRCVSDRLDRGRSLRRVAL